MSQFEELFKNLSTKVEDEGIRNGLLDIFKKMETELGTRGRDLTSYKTEALTFKKLKEVLKSSGIDDAENVEKIAEKLKIQKDVNDEKEALSLALKQMNDEKNKIAKEFSSFKVTSTITDKFNAARNQFKDEKGKGIKIADDFIDKNKLFGDIDVANDVLVQQRIDSVLKEAHEKQSKVISALELPGFTPPVVPEGSQTGGHSAPRFEEQFKNSLGDFGNSRHTVGGAFIDAVRKSQGIKQE